MQSALLNTSAQIISKLIGLISTLFLARILAPDQFAYFALISIVIYFFDVLSDAGSEQYIAQKSRVRSADLNAAWTLDVSIKLVLFVLLQMLATPVAIFLEQPPIADGIQVAAIALLINAAKHPKIFLLKRQLNYGLLFKLTLSQKILAFSVVLPIAYITESFWAFIAADIAAASLFTLASHGLFRRRPKLMFAQARVQWQFSKWLLGKSIVGYCRSQIDTVMVSKFFSATLLGNYYMARDVAMMPGHYLFAPAIEPLLAAFAKLKDTPSQLAEQVTLVCFLTVSLSAPICAFTLLESDNIILLLLGEGWEVSGALLQCLIFMVFYWPLVLMLEKALIAVGKVRSIALFDGFTLLVTASALLSFIGILSSQPGGTTLCMKDLYNLACLRVTIGLATAVLLLCLVKASIPALKTARLLVLCLLPIAAATFATVAIAFIPSQQILFVEIIFKAFVFGGIYLGFMVGLIFSLRKFPFFRRLAATVMNAGSQHQCSG